MANAKRRNKIVQILMDRDEMTETEAKDLLKECKQMIADGYDIEDVLYDELELELDYAIYLLV